MITVSFLGQDISMSRYVFAYGEYLRLFDSYEKRLLQHFEGAKAKGRKEIENIINEEIDRIVHDILKRVMSEDIYSVTKSDILKNKAYIAYTSFCKGENWRSEHYGLYFKKMEEILRKVVDGMMVCYLTILEENERFDGTEIKKFSWDHSVEILSLLKDSPDKRKSLICAFRDWPYSEKLYETALYYDLMDSESCLTCKRVLGMAGFENVAMRSVVEQKKMGQDDTLRLLASAMGEEFANKISKCADDLLRKEREITNRKKAEQEVIAQEAQRLERKKRNRKVKKIVGAIVVAIALVIYGIFVAKSVTMSKRELYGSVGEMRDEMQGRWTHYLTTSNGYGSSALWQWVIDGDEAFMIFHSDDELTDGKEIEWNPLEGTFSIAGTTFVVEKGGNSFVQKNGWNYRKGGYLPKSDDEKQAATYESIYAVLRFSNIRTSNNSLYTICSGTVTNSGKETYKYVQIKGSFKDDRGSVIDTASTYLVGGEGLAPGESTTFKLYVSKNYSISSCDVSIYDYD